MTGKKYLPGSLPNVNRFLALKMVILLGKETFNSRIFKLFDCFGLLRLINP